MDGWTQQSFLPDEESGVDSASGLGTKELYLQWWLIVVSQYVVLQSTPFAS